MSGTCHIVCAGPCDGVAEMRTGRGLASEASAIRYGFGECVKGSDPLTQLVEYDNGDGGVAAERFPHEPKAPVALSCEQDRPSAG